MRLREVLKPTSTRLDRQPPDVSDLRIGLLAAARFGGPVPGLRPRLFMTTPHVPRSGQALVVTPRRPLSAGMTRYGRTPDSGPLGDILGLLMSRVGGTNNVR